MDMELRLLREDAALLTIDRSARLLVSHPNSDTDRVSASSSMLLFLGRGGPRRAMDLLRGLAPSCSWWS